MIVVVDDRFVVAIDRDSAFTNLPKHRLDDDYGYQ